MKWTIKKERGLLAVTLYRKFRIAGIITKACWSTKNIGYMYKAYAYIMCPLRE
jgi:hypothetical protein